MNRSDFICKVMSLISAIALALFLPVAIYAGIDSDTGNGGGGGAGGVGSHGESNGAGGGHGGSHDVEGGSEDGGGYGGYNDRGEYGYDSLGDAFSAAVDAISDMFDGDPDNDPEPGELENSVDLTNHNLENINNTNLPADWKNSTIDHFNYKGDDFYSVGIPGTNQNAVVGPNHSHYNEVQNHYNENNQATHTPASKPNDPNPSPANPRSISDIGSSIHDRLPGGFENTYPGR